MTPNYEFVGINATRLYYQLEQLRASAEFRAMEDTVAARYEKVVIVAADGAVPYKTQDGTSFPEATNAADGVRYIWIDTSTASVKMEDGVLKSMSVEQIFAHAMAHAASDIISGPFTNLGAANAAELEAINRSNIVTVEAGLTGPANTAAVQFVPNGIAGYPEMMFSDGNATIHIQEWLQYRSPSDVTFGRPANRIEQTFDENGDVIQVTGYNDSDGSKGVIDIDQKGEHSWSQKETVFDSQGNIRSVDTYADDGSRAVSGFDEAGFEIWNYEQASDGAAVLGNGDGTSIEFAAGQAQDLSYASDNAPKVVMGGSGPSLTVGLNPESGASSIQLDGGTSFTTPEGGQMSVGADGGVTISAWSPDIDSNWGMGRDGDNSGPGPEPAFGDEHPNPLQPRDPLILDLNGNGIQLIDVHASNAHFDYGGTGFSVKTGWAGPTEGILVRDLDQNANTVTASELFGAISGDGFADLAALDSNHDNKIDSSDTNFSQLKVWVDADSDGVADAGEVVSLASASVAAINLTVAADGSTINGNTVVSTASFVRSNGTTSTVAEVNFATDTLYARYTPAANFIYSQTAFTLPSLVGYGNVPDLIYAMSLDSDLEDAARDLVMDAGSMSASAFQSGFEAFVQTWAGVADLDPASRGPGIDARHIALVEAFYGATYAQLNGANASLNAPTIANIEATYHAIVDELMVRFAAQVPLSQLLNGVSLADIGGNPLLPFASIQFNASTDAIDVDINNLVADIVEAAPEGTEQVGYYDLMARLIKTLRVDLFHESATELVAAFNSAADETDLSDAMRALVVTELAAVNIIDASSVAGTLTGTGLTDAIVINQSGHTVTGKDGADSYIYLPGLAGATTIDDNSTSVGDKLLLVGANPSDVTLSRNGASDDVTLSVAGGGSVTIHNEFVSWGFWGYGAIETVQFADGTAWTVSDMMQLLLDQQSAASSGSVYGFWVNDTLVAGAGGKYLSGGSGNDTYVYAAGNGNVTVDDATSVSSGADTLVLSDINSTAATITRVGTSYDVLVTFAGGGSVTIKNQLGTWDYGTIESVQFADNVTLSASRVREIAEGVDASHVTVLGTSASETLAGTSGPDVFDGLGGNDILQGGYGTDNYRFGIGSGNDRIEEVSEPNTDDRVWLVDLLPSDVQFARVGNDETIKILSSGETLTIKDEFSGTWTGIERLQFADGTSWDRAQLREAAWIRGTSGNDTLTGTLDADTLDGGAGNDTLNGGADGDTYIYGVGSGNDTITEGSSSGATDIIRLVGLNPSDVTLSRSGQNLSITINATGEKLTVTNHFNDTYSGIEQIAFADATTWDRATILDKAWIRGTSGNDTLNGTFDADTLDGGAGNDALNGGANGDTYLFGVGSGNDTITEASSTDATDTLKLTGLNPSDVTLSRSGPDLSVTINSSGEKMTVVGHFYGTYNGIEQIVFADATTWDRATILSKAWIRGTSGNDTLNGTSDPDTLDGGAGNDALNGGAGSDTYVFGVGSGTDTITENSDSGATDTIRLVGLNPSDVTLSRSGQNLSITINATGEKLTVTGHFYDTYSGIERIVFADQTVWDRAQIVLQAPIYGTTGNDNIYGTTTDEAFLGRSGNDYLEGRIGNDTYFFSLGDGQDAIYDWGSGGDVDVLQFGAGILTGNVSVTQVNGVDLRLIIAGTSDTVTLSNQLGATFGGVDQVRFADGTSWDRATLLQKSIVPTSGNDTINGDYTANTLSGAAGNDTLYGRVGNDVLIGGTGNDTVSGDGNDDTYVFNLGDGQDTVKEYGAGSWGGNDTIQFGPGIAAAGVTITEGTGGNDLIISIVGTTDKVTILGGINWGSDYRVEQVRFDDGTTLSYAQLMVLATAATSGNDVFYGDEAANTLSGAAGNDTLYGRIGNDVLAGGTGNDTLSGDGNDDTYLFNLGDGQDTIKEYNAGSWGGNDKIQFGAGITAASLVVTEGTGGNDLIISIAGTTDKITILGGISWGSDFRVEQVRFDDGTTLSHAQLMALATAPTSGNDVFYGDEAANTISGGAGNDTLYGRVGNDVLAGGTGNDTLSGDGNDDTYVFNLGDGQDIVKEYNAGSWGGNDKIQFGPGITAADLAVTEASSGNDLIISIAGTTDQITILGGINWGSDFRVEQVRFDDGTTLSHAQLMALATTETSGNDVFYGDELNNTLAGGGGNDTLNARAGNDTLEGGVGTDNLTGGSGNDTFIFRAGFGQDTIMDFSAGSAIGDVIEFHDGIFANFAAVQAASQQIGSDVQITVDATTSILLKSVLLANLNQNDFAFV